MKIFVQLFVLLCLLNITSTWATDKYAVASGNWSSTSTWSLTRGGASGAAVPGASDNVIIPSPYSVILDASGKNCLNLTIESGAYFVSNNANPTSSQVYVRINGSSVVNNGVIGYTSGAPTVNTAISFEILGSTVTFSGSGITKISRIRNGSAASNTTCIIDQDMILTYTGSTGTGGVGWYGNNGTGTGNTLKINSGRTLTCIDQVYIATNSSVDTDGPNTTIQVDGSLLMQGPNCTMSLRPAAGAVVSLIVNGIVDIGRTLKPTGTTGVTSSITVNSGGELKVGTYGNGVAYFETPTQLVTGLGRFTLGTGGIKMQIGSAYGLDPTNGQIRTSQRSFDAGATYSFMGAAAQVTGPDLPATVGGLIISNASGVTLTNSVNVSGTLNLTNGTLTLGSNNITATATTNASAASYVVTNGTGTLIQNVGSSVIFPVGLASDYTPITFSTTSSARNYCVRVLSISPSGLTGGLARQWFVQETTHPDNTVFGPMTLSWWSPSAQGTLNNAAPCDVVSNTNGSVNSYDLLGTGLTITSGSVTFTPAPLSPIQDITSGLYITAVQTNSLLPVELASFTSNVNGRDINLSWSTKTEKNSNRFDVERLSNQTWVSVGSVKASVLSNSTKQYTFTDGNLQTGKYSYRLKMIDNDGSFNYSKIVETEVALPKAFDLSQNYPNPFNPSTKINYSLPTNSNVTLEVYSISGERIAQLVNENQAAGFYSVNFASSSLVKSISSGAYFYRITAVDNATGNQYSSIKKMMILK